MLIVAGFLVGLMVGITGVGGGALMTPILLLIFGVAPATAVGTDLLFAGITKTAAGKVHHQKKLIDWSVIKFLWLGSLPSSGLALILMNYGGLRLDNVLLKYAISGAILLTVIGILFHKNLHRLGQSFRLEKEKIFKKWQPYLTIIAGSVLGFLVTLTSIGAGAIGVVFLTYLYPLRLTPPRLIATDIVHAIPLALFAGIGHLLMGNVNFSLLGYLLLGSIPGVIIGAKLSASLPQKALRVLLSLVLIFSAMKLVMG